MANIFYADGTKPKTGYYTPPRKLKTSIGSSPSDDGPAVFPAEAADIPDKFATTEHPKLKFLFSVEFITRSDDLILDNTGSTDMTQLIFPLRKASRPTISPTYQNINFYNYRTQVQTKIEYGSTPATLTFYDDISNRSLNLMAYYLNAVSPISNRTIEEADSFGSSTLDSGGSASVGDLVNAMGPLKAIRVAHHSFMPSNPQQLQSIYYDYLNPKIINYNLDELDMSASDVTNVEISFTYDSVKITTPEIAAVDNAASGNGSATVTIGTGQKSSVNGGMVPFPPNDFGNQ